MEDIRYDMISDVMFNHRLLDANVNLGTMHKDITFTAYNPAKLRLMVGYIQQKVMEFRRMHDVQQASNSPAAASNLQTEVVSNMVVPPQTAPMNPYKSPVMIRRRVSRFY
jgi:hypothetical protein